MRILLSILLGGVLCLSLRADDPAATKSPTKKSADDGKQSQPMSFWMEKKLEYSQNVLRGLAQSDFDAIKSNGEQMRLLNKVEAFVRRKNPDYRTHFNAFERACSDIVRQADRENLEGATLAYNQLTVSCVSCHQSMREGDGGKKVERASQSKRPKPVSDSPKAKSRGPK